MGAHRCVALDLPGFGALRDAARGHLDQGLRARRSSGLRRARGRRRRSSSATRWAASSAPSWRSRSRRASSGSCSSRPPACRSSTSAARRPLLGARASARARGARGRRTRHRARGRAGRALRRAGAPGRRALPGAALRPARPDELVQGAGKPGFLPALEALIGYSSATGWPRSRCPTLIVWGATTCSSRSATRERYERLIGDNARAVIFDDTGHVSMIERPQALQRAARGVPRRRRQRGAEAEGVSA